jgi:phosphoribosylformylglycinamidine cyclo-ligase
VHGIGHITGGAFTKLTRLVGARKLQFRLDALDATEPPPIFKFLQREGEVGEKEMYQTFNMGVGLCLVAPPSQADAIIRAYKKRGLWAGQIGNVKAGVGVFVGNTRIA